MPNEFGSVKSVYLRLLLQKNNADEIILNPISGHISFEATTESKRKKFIQLSQDVANFLNIEFISQIPVDNVAFSEYILNFRNKNPL